MGDKSCPLCASGVVHVHDPIQTVHDTEVVTVKVSNMIVADSTFVPTGVCHCGESMDDHSTWGNHSPTDMADDSGYDANTLKKQQAASKAAAIAKSMGELQKIAKETGPIVILNQTNKHYSNFVADDVVSSKNFESPLLGGPSASNAKFSIPTGMGKTGQTLTVSGIKAAMDKFVYGPSIVMPGNEASVDTDLAQDYLHSIGVGIMVINGHKMESILATYANFRNEELQNRMEDMVNARVAAELQKQHKRSCIPSYRSKNDRKFRA